ncbi:MAG TPA: vanadium-dependent haloperoxidase [Pyrinomonadaceae bacterium]|nr:vanadium-dependent haloperoxidase [Pyrinomonadaceae bacterium]
MKLPNWCHFALLLVLVAAPASVAADTVTDWNAIAVQATVTAARPGQTGILDLAMVHVAIHDAVQAIEKKYEPYYVEIPGASGSPDAAAVKAAYDVLVSRFSAQAPQLLMIYQQYLLSHGLSETDPGIAVGAKAAAGIIALRACDGSFPVPAPPPFVGDTAIGVWRPTPPGNLPMLAPWLGNVTPFTINRPSQFRAAPPPALPSRDYARDYNEIKAIGALNNSTRNAEETDLAHFWNLNYGVVWHQGLRDIAITHVDNISDSARLFALADIAVADSLISSWNNKNYYVYWRPITAIREGNNDGNPWTVGDPNWSPLITTPNYPDYTSGANSFTGAVTRVLQVFFDTDHMAFSLTTTNTGPTIQDTRPYNRFSAAADDVVEARILEGIHFRTADEVGRRQARQVANWAFKNYLRPIGKHKDGKDDEDGPDDRR